MLLFLLNKSEARKFEAKFCLKILMKLLFLSIILNCKYTEGWCANKKLPLAKSQTRIRSDIIDIKQKSQKIDFIDNVVVEKDDVSLLANRMSVYYLDKKFADKEQTQFTSSKNDKSSNIKEIKAFGNVRMFSDSFVASSNNANYDPNQNIFILQDDVIVNNGSSVLKGDKFIYNLITKKGDFVGKNSVSGALTAIENDNKPNRNTNYSPDNRVTVIIGNDIEQQKENFIKDQEDN